ncbi:uncharacterized protein ASPGLDRAFT_28930 [Aspergillus glaucus CBS 516.65]|uniref:Uncharacterized protein n=1 Tax=Aspergillus glaucus CBS 516.65 TaxID=1160497 RepID=A0A1L9V9H7_ASPGL|nr:hypothetical protein ASPGLDRAFT_28930 [Aspergillus glaucus CBS 516.65]OJJ80560.1 hypothetical protein ASPGLDRAFT_28930 [Aspergillus glaucus CBS 516.65]
MSEGGGYNPFLEAEKEKGRPSVIYDYCRKALEQGHEECIWICMKRGGKWIAQDIKLEESSFPIRVDELRKIFSWWKRYSFYSAVGVKEVMIRFMSYDSTKNKITVVVTDFNYDELQNGIVESIEHALESGFEPGTCGVDIRGESACEKVAGTFCLNTKDNGFEC